MAIKKPVKSTKPKKKTAEKTAPKKAAKPVKATPKPSTAKAAKTAPKPSTAKAAKTAPKPKSSVAAKVLEVAPEPAPAKPAKSTLTLKSSKAAEPAPLPAKLIKTEPKPKSSADAEPVLLSGGNPQIAKAEGDDPVQNYIAEMPGWKHDIGRRLDAIVTRNVPGMRKAVKWNSPFYGVASTGDTTNWFLSFHCFTKYVKVAFFGGAALEPLPPGESTQKNVRYLDIYEGDKLDEAQFADWVKQASKLPGWRM